MVLAVVADAFIFSEDDLLIGVVKEILQLKSVSNISEGADSDEALDALKRFPKGMFIVDWKVGPALVVKFLKEATNSSGIANRPIFLICEQMENAIIPISLEYGITQVHVGSLDQQILASNLGNAIRRINFKNEFKEEFEKIVKSRKANEHTQVIKLLTTLYENHKDNLTIRAELAESYFQAGQFKEALKILTPVPDMNPPNSRYLHVYGRCLMKLGIYTEAESTFAKVTLLNPYDPDKLVGLGQALTKLGKLGKANDAFNKALEIDDDNVNALMGKGELHLLTGDVNAALELLENIANPNELASIFNSAAILLIRKQHFAKGMQLYEAALQSIPNNKKIAARLFFNMGVGYRRQNDPQKALEAFKKAVEQDPKYDVAKANLETMTTVLKRSKSKPKSEDSPYSYGENILVSPTVTTSPEPKSPADVINDLALDFNEDLLISKDLGELDIDFDLDKKIS